MAIEIPFLKMNGAGNEIVVTDMRATALKVDAKAAIALAGEIAYDQLMEISTSDQSELDANIRIFNQDGSLAQACGNGMRCVVAYLHQQSTKKNWLFRSPVGLLKAEYKSPQLITVDMGVPSWEWDQIPLTEEFADTTKIELQIGPIDAPVLHSPSVMNMGNPHAIFWVDNDVNSYELDKFGPMLENHPIFPDRANITIAQQKADDHFIIRTWERGTGLTLACGSAACSTLVAANRLGLCARKATITPPSGLDLVIEWDNHNHVWMSGPAEFEFSGLLDPQTGEIKRQ